MAPVTALKTPAPIAAPKPPLTDQQFGELYARRDALDTSVTVAKSQLEDLDAAIAKTKDPATRKGLEQKRARLAKELVPEQKKLEAADRALSSAFAEISSSADPRQQVASLYSRLESTEKALGPAQAELSKAGAQLKADLAALDAAKKTHRAASPEVAAALKKATASERRAAQAGTTVTNLEAAKQGLTVELKTRQAGALAAAKKGGATSAEDTVDLASAKREQQAKVIGAPVVGVDPAVAAETDRKRIAAATQASPANGALMLGKQLEDSEPQQQSKLIKAASAEIRVIAANAQWSAPAAEPLLDALKTARGTARTELATEVARSLTTLQSPMMVALDARMKAGDGFSEAGALEQGLRKAGKPQLAEQVRALRTERLEALAQAHHETSAKVETLNTELARLTVGFGQVIDPTRRQQAIEAFQAKHKSEYDAWNASGTKLVKAAEFIAENPDEVPRARELLPDSLDTPGGQKAIERALDLQAKGKPTLLDSAPQLGKDSLKVATNLQMAVTRAAGARVLSLIKTDPQAAMRAVDSIKRNATLFAVNPASLNKITESLKGVLAGDPNAVGALQREIETAKGLEAGGGIKPNNNAYAALKGLGIAFSAAAGIEKLGKDDLYSKVKGTGEVLQAGADAGVLAMEMFAGSKLPNLLTSLKGAAGAGQALGAVLDGIAAGRYFYAGDHAQGLASSASAVGGAILATAAFTAAAGVQVVPIGGQIVGGLLVIGGTVGKWAIEAKRAGKKEAGWEKDAKAFLMAGGIDEKSAEKLKDIKRKDGRNVGMMLNQIAPGLNLTPKQLFDHLVKLGPEAIEQFTDMAKELQIGDKGRIVEQAPWSSTLQDAPAIYTTEAALGLDDTLETVHRPLSRRTAVEWTRNFLMMKGIPPVPPRP